MSRGRPTPLVNPLLSVVMPIYNEKHTVEEIIERVRGCPAFPMTPAQVDEALHQELWDGPSGDNPGRIIL